MDIFGEGADQPSPTDLAINLGIIRRKLAQDVENCPDVDLVGLRWFTDVAMRISAERTILTPLLEQMQQVLPSNVRTAPMMVLRWQTFVRLLIGSAPPELFDMPNRRELLQQAMHDAVTQAFTMHMDSPETGGGSED